jgi:hypothetical protein
MQKVDECEKIKQDLPEEIVENETYEILNSYKNNAMFSF